MSNRGSANMNITVESPEESDTKAHVRINLERAVAKLMVRNDSKEIYTLKNSAGVTYATVRLNNYKFINLANKFYTSAMSLNWITPLRLRLLRHLTAWKQETSVTSPTTTVTLSTPISSTRP